ncbi:MAG: hypothetical protein C5S45_01850 [Candidatus Methanocomedens sp.]|nr:MAG: hypothetical protein C5S45_01850 [ANME-2 cluster archaeon]
MVIARTSGSMNWLFTEQDYGYTDLLAKVDTINGAVQKVLLFLLSSWIYRIKGMVDYNFFKYSLYPSSLSSISLKTSFINGRAKSLPG